MGITILPTFYDIAKIKLENSEATKGRQGWQNNSNSRILVRVKIGTNTLENSLVLSSKLACSHTL